METPSGLPPECPAGARLIPLTQGLYAIVDEDDYEALAAHRWCAFRPPNSRTVYAGRGVRRPDGGGTSELMHRRILPGSENVDHINGDGLDNRRSNLRAATVAENQRNRRGPNANGTSGFIGVSWRPDVVAHWRVHIRVDRSRRYFGYYDSPVAAAIAHDIAAIELHGEFASLNFPGLRRPLPIVPLTKSA